MIKAWGIINPKFMESGKLSLNSIWSQFEPITPVVPKEEKEEDYEPNFSTSSMSFTDYLKLNKAQKDRYHESAKVNIVKPIKTKNHSSKENCKK
jgi:hypothetical protein